FRISGLAPGRYFLHVQPGLPYLRTFMTSIRILGTKPPYEIAETWYPSADDVSAGAPIDLPPGGEIRERAIQARPGHSHTIRVTPAPPHATSSNPMLSMFSPNGMSIGREVRYGVAYPFPNSAPGTYVVTGEDRTLGVSVRQSVKVTDSDVDLTLTLGPNI